MLMLAGQTIIISSFVMNSKTWLTHLQEIHAGPFLEHDVA